MKIVERQYREIVELLIQIFIFMKTDEAIDYLKIDKIFLLMLIIMKGSHLVM
jgi:hypothetical protein